MYDSPAAKDEDKTTIPKDAGLPANFFFSLATSKIADYTEIRTDPSRKRNSGQSPSESVVCQD